MKNFVRTFLLSCLCAAFTTMPISMPDDIAGTPPPKFAPNWTRLSILGDRNHPFLIIWVSPRYFRRTEFERILTLTDKEYAHFVAFSRSLSCSGIPLNTRSNALMITEHSGSNSETICVMPHSGACDFLVGVANLQNIRWTEGKVRPLYELSVNISCPTDKRMRVPRAH